MTNIHVRGLEASLVHQLKKAAAHENISVNTLILVLLRQGLGLTQKRKITIYHDLDKFAGKWSEHQAKIFMKNIVDFEKIDEDLWK